MILVFSLLFTLINSNERNLITKVNTQIDFQNEGNLVFFDATTNQKIKMFDIEIAKTESEIETGLMHRTSMNENEAMLFIFSKIEEHFFDMKNTRFALDIIFMNEYKRIVSFQKNTKPFDESFLSSIKPSKFVLEVNAGMANKLKLALGDKMTFVEY